ncbi:MAG: hypothetical protein QOH49_4963 [Acidobacteriota bacterium]|nr:hypothetical protein [Acidobacteriota bacterium]
MKSHKKQHYIPRSYLKAWVDPHTPAKQTPYVWQFSKDGTAVKKKAPENIFHENDMYTIEEPGGGRDLVLEKGLSGLESGFCSIRDKKLKNHKSLTDEEHVVLCAFIAAMSARTKAWRDHQAGQWGNVLEMVDRVHEQAKGMTPDQRKAFSQFSPPPAYGRDTSLSYEQVQQLATKPLQSLLVPNVRVMLPLLRQMSVAVIETNNSPGFITSDHPCCWYDPEAYKRPPFWRSPALAYPSIEITLPLSPRQTLWLKWDGAHGYIPVPHSVVEELNRRSRFHAHEFFIVNANVKKDAWFDRGVEPEDSWEKIHAATSEDEEEE